MILSMIRFTYLKNRLKDNHEKRQMSAGVLSADGNDIITYGTEIH